MTILNFSTQATIHMIAHKPNLLFGYFKVHNGWTAIYVTSGSHNVFVIVQNRKFKPIYLMGHTRQSTGYILKGTQNLKFFETNLTLLTL